MYVFCGKDGKTVYGRNEMKKNLLTGLTLAAVLAASLAACGSSAATTETKAESKTETKAGETAAQAAASDWKWDRNVEIICPWGNGGGADTTARQFATALEKQLGTSVVVNNKAGGGGVTGVQFALSQPADGYSYFLCTPSPMLAQISGATDLDVHNQVKPLFQIVHDCNVFVASGKAEYKNYDELMKYIDAHPGEVKCGVMTITGLDAACVEGTFGDKVEAVAYTEGSQLNADVIGGHIALACVGPAEVQAMIDSGDMIPILSCTEKRMTTKGFENCECTGEKNIDCYYGPYRFIGYKEGTPDAALKSLSAAAEKAMQDPDFQKWIKQEGLDQRETWRNQEDLSKQWEQDFTDLTKMFGAAK